MAQHQKEPDIPTRHLSEEKRRELDEKARQGETVVPGGTGGKSLEAQERLAEGRSRGGQTRSGQLGAKGYEEMGRKGGKSAGGKSAEEAMAEKECTLTNLSSRPNPKTECFRSGKTMSQEGAEKQLFKCVHSQVGECMNMFHFASCSSAHVAFA